MRFSLAVGLATALGLAATALPASPAAAAAAAASRYQCNLYITRTADTDREDYLLTINCDAPTPLESFSVHGSDQWDDDWLFTHRGRGPIVVEGSRLNEDLADRDEIYAKVTVNGHNVGTNKVYGWYGELNFP